MSTLPLVIHKEKRLVLLNRTAKAPAELVLFVRRSGRRPHIEEVFGIEDIIPDKFEHAAMESIGAGLGNHIDDPARLTSEFRAVRSLVDVKFLNVVHRRVQNLIVKVLIGDGHPINEVQIVTSSLAENPPCLSRLLQRPPACARWSVRYARC